MDRSDLTYKKFALLYIVIAVSVVLSATVILEIGAYLMFSWSNRLPSVRDLNENYRMYFIKDFIRRKIDLQKEYVIVIGDSQFFGFRENEEATFPYLIAKDNNLNVINLSLQGGGAADMVKVLRQLNGVKIRYIFYNLNINHFVKWLEASNIMTEASYLPESNDKPVMNTYTLGAQLRYFFNITPHYPFHQKTTTTEEEREGSKLYTMPKRSFDIVLEKKGPLFELCELIKKTSQHLIIASPQFKDNLEYNGFDLDKIKRNLQWYENAMREEGMNYINMTFAFERSDFIDETHLNKNGHRKMAQVLKKYLKVIT